MRRTCTRPAPVNGGLQCQKEKGGRGLDEEKAKACNEQICPGKNLLDFTKVSLFKCNPDINITGLITHKISSDQIYQFHRTFLNTFLLRLIIFTDSNLKVSSYTSAHILPFALHFCKNLDPRNYPYKSTIYVTLPPQNVQRSYASQQSQI